MEGGGRRRDACGKKLVEGSWTSKGHWIFLRCSVGLVWVWYLRCNISLSVPNTLNFLCWGHNLSINRTAVDLRGALSLLLLIPCRLADWSLFCPSLPQPRRSRCFVSSQTGDRRRGRARASILKMADRGPGKERWVSGPRRFTEYQRYFRAVSFLTFS